MDDNPKRHPSTVNIVLIPVDEVHRDIKSIIHILLKPETDKKMEE